MVWLGLVIVGNGMEGVECDRVWYGRGMVGVGYGMVE